MELCKGEGDEVQLQGNNNNGGNEIIHIYMQKVRTTESRIFKFSERLWEREGKGGIKRERREGGIMNILKEFFFLSEAMFHNLTV